MWERLSLAVDLFWRVLNDPVFSRHLRKTLARNMASLAEEARHQERADGAARLLAVLQREGRLVDFLREDISGFSDDQVGAAARGIHGNCRKVLEKVVPLRKVLDFSEGAAVTITAEELDPSAIRLIGEVGPKPPYTGALRHHGWRAAEVRLPAIPEGQDPQILGPAEVEVGAS